MLEEHVDDRQSLSREERCWHATFRSLQVKAKNSPEGLVNASMKSHGSSHYPVDSIVIGIEGLETLKPQVQTGSSKDEFAVKGLEQKKKIWNVCLAALLLYGLTSDELEFIKEDASSLSNVSFFPCCPLIGDLLLKGGTLVIFIAINCLDMAGRTLGRLDVADRTLVARITTPQGVGTIPGPSLLVIDRSLLTGEGYFCCPWRNISSCKEYYGLAW
ncbi:hypothetical protein Droror1_Dr00018999 [Drosera rotundifolia]